MTIFLSFAGARDPVADDTNEEGSIVTLWRWWRDHGQPVDQVWLFSVNAEGQQYAQNTRDWLISEHLCTAEQIQLYHREASPVDYEAVTQFAFEVVQQNVNTRNDNDVTIFFNASSGTPTMKLSGSLLSAAGLLPGGKIWTVLNPRHVGEHQERVSVQDVRFIGEYLLRERLGEAVAGNQFQTAIALAQEWGRITIHDVVRRTSAALLSVLRAYRAWDLTDFAVARRYLTQVDRLDAVPWTPEGRDAFDRQRRWLNNTALESTEENPLNLVELYYSIERYSEQERYTDALARGRRLVEGLLYYYYHAQYRVNVRRVAKHWVGQLPQNLAEKFRDEGERYVPLLVLARTLTEESPDPTVRELWADIDTFKALMDVRNQSLAAHGMQPVTREDVAKVRPILRKWVMTLVPDTGEYLKLYPLTPAMRQRVLQDLGLPPGRV
ncbi:hypothetical protein [Sulfobacillus sp. hq2]|uniref:hypothetical protein n=1 Tax=Sulfobacillus sp. hq2 TaxID=2039167 RepID=UPI000CD2C77E|nr:hypothetical protein [Sulfobacillus sp. hq2]POB10107.1 hypothetical protein CO251_11515 [Sulfobacillus sp. hq2]